MNYTLETGLRGCLRHPRTMALAVLTLALGLASVMTMLTLLSVLSVDPLPGVSHRLHLAWVDGRPGDKSGSDADATGKPVLPLWKLEDVNAMRQARADIRQVALVSAPLSVSTVDGDSTHTGSAVLAIGPMLPVFGVPLRHGRFWTPEEEQSRTPVVVISRALSERLLGRADGTGAEIRIGRHAFRVIGISERWAPRPRPHFLPSYNAGWQGDGDEVFVPALAALESGVEVTSTRECEGGGFDGFRFDQVNVGGCRWLVLWAELKDAAQRESYARSLQAFAAQRHADGAFERPAHSWLRPMADWLRFNRVVPDSVRLNLWLAVGLLALCLVNVAGLLAARFLRRAGEHGVRRVLGAPRRAIIAACLVESALAGLLGGLIALPLTLAGLWLMRQQGDDYAPLARFSPVLFATLLGLALLTGLLVGLLPALRAARQEPALQVKTL
ncbi:ABC transporter permease [Stenotrophomonas mori]|uniref:ABC transporter permease n=1 Tax=Stenotrophomonas mori TaxID=2871096 RepID=A0ABT0SIV8_9GAMM|nr:ABC transporter permease [Stenotrophomonas mori]MCL7715259.1 ABC transporter permease [Stenotrophomonas mori]